MSFSKNILAAVGFATLANAHIILNTPAPFSVPQPQQGPLDIAERPFPCQNGDKGGYAGAATTMELGSTNPLSFTGGAVHGGGSCQVSITYDTEPSSSSVWKVVTSIQGGCVARNTPGNIEGAGADFANPNEYNYTIPADIPAGKATLAWTWFNKVGNREFYMNCAPIELTGAGGDQAAFDALPNMAVANAGTNQCTTTEGTDVEYAEPGATVFTEGAGPFGPLVGDNCFAPGAGASAAGGAAAAPAASAAAKFKRTRIARPHRL